MATEQVRFAPQQDTERKRHHQSSRSVVEVLRLPGPRHPHHGVVKEDIPQAEQRIRRKERAVEMLEHRDEDLGDLYTEIGQTLHGSFSAGWLAGIPDESSKTDGTGSSLPDLDKKNVLGCIEAEFCK